MIYKILHNGPTVSAIPPTFKSFHPLPPMPGMLLPQGFAACCSLCLKSSSTTHPQSSCLCQNLCSSVLFSVSPPLITLFKIVIHHPMPALPFLLPCFILFQHFHSLTNLVKEFFLLPLSSSLEHTLRIYHFFSSMNHYWLK